MSKRLGFVVALAVLMGLSDATLYKVGDNQGWKSGVNYTEWSDGKTFYIGDTIVFNYGRETENVVQVTHKTFRNCSSDNPIRVFHTGKDVFNLEKRSHLYFICGLPGHCESGQKVDIRVLGGPESPAPAPAPETAPPSPSASPASPTTAPPSSSWSPDTPPSSDSPSPSPAPGPSPSSAVRGGWGVQLAVAAFVVVLSVVA
ncbi:mavicyanin-like [Zingiber officinale]|uniref:mavicyanin-like n=1 Tax=Zingiber officinale TaxID=94328 RepID=UPI001C4C22EB|nr:mavicyanin-like [Zingiber officinale]